MGRTAAVQLSSGRNRVRYTTVRSGASVQALLEQFRSGDHIQAALALLGTNASMLMGLDNSSGGAEHEPPVIKVTDRAPVGTTITVYARRSLSTADRVTVREAVSTAELLEDAGLVESARFRRWPLTGQKESDGEHPYREFVDAVGAESLESFVSGLRSERPVEFPAICVAIRANEDVVGLYPRRVDGDRQTVQDCLVALSGGKPVRNVERDTLQEG